MIEEKKATNINFNNTNCKKPQFKKPVNPNKMKMTKNPIKFLTKKIGHFNVESLCKYSKKAKGKIITKEGRWSKEEHEKFLKGIILYGTNWKKIRALIDTRTTKQICSHAQKFYIRMKTYKDEELGLDFTLDSVCSIKDMINQIESINKNYDIIEILNRLKTNINKKKSTLNYENINKTKFVKENFNNDVSTKFVNDEKYYETLNDLIKENNQYNNYTNLNNILNIENTLENINRASSLIYNSNNYLKSNSNINNLLLPLLKKQNNIINTANIINSLYNNNSINQIDLLENNNYNNVNYNNFNKYLFLYNINNN